MTTVDTAKLKDLRNRANLTLEEVARLLGYKTPVGYHYVESGRCKLSADRAAILARVLGVAMEDLFLARQVTDTVNDDSAPTTLAPSTP